MFAHDRHASTRCCQHLRAKVAEPSVAEDDDAAVVVDGTSAPGFEMRPQAAR